MSRVAHMASRAALVCGLLSALVFALPRAADAQPSAGISVVNGHDTTIGKWPWQVGIAVAQRYAPKAPTSRRFFCGGSVLAPRLIITAGHCVADLKMRQVRGLEVVSGRTRLNSNRGEVARVVDLRMPKDAQGKRRYRKIYGAADWDVALLKLDRPLSAQPIQIAGADEAGSWAAGQKAWATGWGITRAFSRSVPARLQVADQAIMGQKLCRRSEGVSFKTNRMLCVGGPGGHASSCNGDSGGPLVVKSGEEYRLVGLTSYGDIACRGFVPSIYTKVAGNPIRDWVDVTAKRWVDADVVGSGGETPTPPSWCRVPALTGLSVAGARNKLEAGGCRLGRVIRDPWSSGPSRRVVGYSRLPGWLAKFGSRINVWVNP